MKAPGFISAAAGIALAIASVAPLTAHAALKYQTDAYVQYGLVVHLDGIANAGVGAPHDATTNKWANLACPTNPAGITSNGLSGWHNGTGYYFCWNSAAASDKEKSNAVLSYAAPAMTQATFEFVFEGSWAEQSSKNWPCFLSCNSTSSISPGQTASPLYFSSGSWTGINSSGEGATITNWSWKQASFTFGAAGADGLKSYDQGILIQSKTRPTAVEYSIPAARWTIAQRLGQQSASRQLTGIMKSVRIYNRALSASEVAHNAAIDAARFDGVMPVTNAVVATDTTGAFGNEVPGVYAVDGSHVFTAPPSATVGAATYALTGYTIERFENGAWSAPVVRSGIYAVAVSESDLVRITWNWTLASGTLGGPSGAAAYMPPLSNAVVVTADPRGLSGREPAGAYLPQGWTFTSGTATQTVGAISYAPAGCMLETWDAALGQWRVTSTVPCGGNVAAEYTSPTATPFASMRLTWLWEPVAGIRRAADYTIGDYVPGGLALWYDGICNDGIGAPHVSAPDHRWRELVSGSQASMGTNANSHWTSDGYYFAVGPDVAGGNRKSYAYITKFISLGTVGTIEIACDTKASQQTAEWAKYLTFGQTNNASSGGDNQMCIQVCERQTYLRLADDDWTGNNETVYAGTEYASWKYRANTSSPWDGKHAAFAIDVAEHRSYSKGVRDQTRPRYAVKPMAAAYWMMGNKWSGGTYTKDQLVGTMKAVRAYNRVLSDEEIAHNYAVDVARFDGVLAMTNVVVAASDYNGALAADAYEVCGSYTFEGAAGPEGLPNRVKVWTLQNGSWSDPESIPEGFYTYTPGTSPATVRIEFGRTNPFVMIFR